MSENILLTIVTCLIVVVIVMIFCRMLKHKLFIPRFFKEIQSRYSDNVIMSTSFFSNRLSFSTDICKCEILICSNSIVSPPYTQITAYSTHQKAPFHFRISNASASKLNHITIGNMKDKPNLIAESNSDKQELQKLISPVVLDLCMELLMVESYAKSRHSFEILFEESTVSLHMDNLIKNAQHLQLLTECVQGLTKSICIISLPHEGQTDRKKVTQFKDSSRYIKSTFIFLILFSLILFILTGLLFHKKKTFYSTADEFSGTVIIKRIIGENEYYLFIPHKVQVSKEDFSFINEGDKIEKKKGQEKITVIQTEDASNSDDFLNLLQD